MADPVLGAPWPTPCSVHHGRPRARCTMADPVLGCTMADPVLGAPWPTPCSWADRTARRAAMGTAHPAVTGAIADECTFRPRIHPAPPRPADAPPSPPPADALAAAARRRARGRAVDPRRSPHCTFAPALGDATVELAAGLKGRDGPIHDRLCQQEHRRRRQRDAFIQQDCRFSPKLGKTSIDMAQARKRYQTGGDVWSRLTAPPPPRRRANWRADDSPRHGGPRPTAKGEKREEDGSKDKDEHHECEKEKAEQKEDAA
eukprot:gene17087-59411_t